MADRVLLACKVAAVVDSLIVLNRGADDGVEIGMTFALGSVVPIHDPDTEEHLGDVDQRPRLQVAGIRPHIAVCYSVGVRPVQASIGEIATVVIDSKPTPPPPPVPDFGSSYHADRGGTVGFWGVVRGVFVILVVALAVTAVVAGQGWR